MRRTEPCPSGKRPEGEPASHGLPRAPSRRKEGRGHGVKRTEKQLRFVHTSHEDEGAAVDRSPPGTGWDDARAVAASPLHLDLPARAKRRGGSVNGSAEVGVENLGRGTSRHDVPGRPASGRVSPAVQEDAERVTVLALPVLCGHPAQSGRGHTTRRAGRSRTHLAGP